MSLASWDMTARKPFLSKEVCYIHLPHLRGSYVLSLSSESLVFSGLLWKYYSENTKLLLYFSQLPSLANKKTRCQSKSTEETCRDVR